jgi:hypothetical protein
MKKHIYFTVSFLPLGMLSRALSGATLLMPEDPTAWQRLQPHKRYVRLLEQADLFLQAAVC